MFSVSRVKKFLAIIVLLVVTVSVTACGSPSSTIPPVTAPPVTTPPPTTPPPTTPPPTTPPPTTPPPTAPVLPTVGFSASAYSIPAGNSVVLTVVATEATSVVITGTDGSSYSLAVTGGTQSVTPATTTTYTATVTGDGGCVSALIPIVVIPAPVVPVGTTISNIQTSSGNWSSFGQVGPNYVDCGPSPCEGISWSMQTGITSPSLSNNATQFNLGGTTPYGDVLFTAPVIGAGASGVKDSNHTLLPTLHNFTYDVDVYVTNLTVTQALEFDISQWLGSAGGMTFGTQCSVRGDKSWDVYDNSTRHWVSTGIPCELVTGWNHLTINVERDSGNNTIYNSIALNGTVNSINVNYPSVVTHPTWWGINVNFQMDGDSKPDAETDYLDNFSFTYY